MKNTSYWYVCRGCHRGDFELHEPVCPTCGNDDSTLTVYIKQLWILSHNLAMAGALCRAFALGRDCEYDVQCQPGRYRMREVRSQAWRPGCERPAP